MFFTIQIALTIITSVITQGSSYFEVSSCSPKYFLVIVLYTILMILLNTLASIYLVKKTIICEKGGYSFDEGDVKWTYKKCLFLSLFGVIIGIVVALLGMGGGNIIGPVLLSLGVRPEVSTISSTFSIFLSSGTAAAQFIIAGDIDVYYALWFSTVSIIGSFFGIVILRKLAIKRNRVSVLIVLIAIILFASLIIIPTVGIINAIQEQSEGKFQLGFTSIC